MVVNEIARKRYQVVHIVLVLHAIKCVKCYLDHKQPIESLEFISKLQQELSMKWKTSQVSKLQLTSKDNPEQTTRLYGQRNENINYIHHVAGCVTESFVPDCPQK